MPVPQHFCSSLLLLLTLQHISNLWQKNPWHLKNIKAVCWWGHMTIIPQIYEILPLKVFHIKKINVNIKNYIN